MKTILILFLISVVFFLCMGTPAFSDEKDDALTVSNFQMLAERVLRLEMQLALINQQYNDRTKDLDQAKVLRDELAVKVKAIEEKRKKAEEEKKANDPVKPDSSSSKSKDKLQKK